MNDAPDPRWPPPSFWLSDANTAWAVLENGLMVVRFADVGDLVEAAGEHARLEGDQIVVASEAEHVTWANAIGMVMNGFDTVAGTASMMRSQIHQLSGRPRSRGDRPPASGLGGGSSQRR